jgi:hypothetical protein
MKIPFSVHFLRGIRCAFLNQDHVDFINQMILLKEHDAEATKSEYEHLNLLLDYAIEKKYVH